VNFTLEFSEFSNNSIEILDFEVNEDFFCFLERKSGIFLLISHKGNFSDLSEKIVKKLIFPTNASRIEMTKSRFFILYKPDSFGNTSFLSEYSLNPLRDYEHMNTKELKDFKDLYIGEDYMIISYMNYAVLSPHSIIAPFEANKGLETIFDVKNLDFIEPFIVNSENSSVIPFRLMKDSSLQLMRIHMNEGKLACDTGNASFGDYSLNLEVFMMKCEFLNKKCNKSDETNYYSRNEEIMVKILENDEISHYNVANRDENREKSKEKNEGVILALTICLCVAFGLIICCVVYAFKLKRVSEQLMKNQGKYVERVMSKEEIEGIKTLKGRENTDKSLESV